ncbi:response regulator transcription factor [Streptomyces sp. SID13666]|uniref:response regulator transcription factor n=1 Tax=unclassified Streptomyces TaxID=2593676 RepID=UPI0013C1C11A|nr:MULTISPECIES: response regulator transcription factor [unclassified Streptomyces]NEA55103.1 response regulator transcription factor [Streptomyces sp. SID13666]NEA71110.1 response regulator transcription factor [Streptomyces sp. SID13588]
MPGSPCISVLLVDSHPISLTGLHTILDGRPDMRVTGVAQDDDTAAAQYGEQRPDVVIINSHKDAAQALNSMNALSRSRSPLPPPNVLVLVDDVDAVADHVLQAGAKGLLSSGSSTQELTAAVRIMATGRSLLIPRAQQESGDSPLEQLTEREIEVFGLMTRGYSNAEISTELTLSQSTVKSHIQKVMEKLSLRNRVHAVIFAYENNIITAGPLHHGPNAELVRPAREVAK